MLLAKLSYTAGDYAGAIRGYEELLKAGKPDPVLLGNLALARWKNGEDYSGTLADLRAMGPSGVFLADYSEGRINYELKDYARASGLLAKAAASSSVFPDFTDQAGLFWLAADSAFKNGGNEAAYGFVQQLLKLDPAHKDGLGLLAKLQKARKVAARKKK
jgi:tetratricopeptide (TPR) repeat protein